MVFQYIILMVCRYVFQVYACHKTVSVEEWCIHTSDGMRSSGGGMWTDAVTGTRAHQGCHTV